MRIITAVLLCLSVLVSQTSYAQTIPTRDNPVPKCDSEKRYLWYVVYSRYTSSIVGSAWICSAQEKINRRWLEEFARANTGDKVFILNTIRVDD